MMKVPLKTHELVVSIRNSCTDLYRFPPVLIFPPLFWSQQSSYVHDQSLYFLWESSLPTQSVSPSNPIHQPLVWHYTDSTKIPAYLCEMSFNDEKRNIKFDKSQRPVACCNCQQISGARESERASERKTWMQNNYYTDALNFEFGYRESSDFTWLSRSWLARKTLAR